MKKLLSTLAVTATFAIGGHALADDYPTKSVNMIVPFSAGGGNDTFVRALQPLLEEQLGESLVIRNIAGGGGAVGMSRAVASEPDGYTLLAASNAMLTLEAMGNVPFTHDDFDFIAKVVDEPYILAVGEESPYEDLDSLVEAASDSPVKVGSSGVGSSAYITANAIANRTGAKLNLIPYPGGSEAISAAMGGHVDAVVLGGAELRSALESGRLEALATTYAERGDSLPDVPTFKESGYDLVLSVWRGIAAPKGLPQEVKDEWVAAVQQIVDDGSYEETANNLGTKLSPLFGDKLEAFIDESAGIMREAAGDLAK
ncbi:tripartite tricarboxylate transporter substrate binding protein [Halomonas eurihalina]|uniref:Tripartite tricarboxylate transporter substrate binding protein n=1 Tax=Halomonas eurihalina TaxID=42566 RepID=A0A5D9D8Z8_HALER|nr:tripartite tricarboxylate transporter substrate binding protein [Halomonas eurihalina]MDR5860540.1 tripartite tricarboxylate transporter substrate binding protein [Halomonas eurihalina]TZG40227.1 tripartite tricarboxylate transporter substrate binding protein [Halomonas eurihalina]